MAPPRTPLAQAHPLDGKPRPPGGSSPGPAWALLLLAQLALAPACVDLTKPWDRFPAESGGTSGAINETGGSIAPGLGGSGTTSSTGGVGGRLSTGGSRAGGAQGHGGATGDGGTTPPVATGGGSGFGGTSDVDAPLATGGLPDTGGSPDGDGPLETGGVAGWDGGDEADGPTATGGTLDGGHETSPGTGGVTATGGIATGGAGGTGAVVGSGGSTVVAPYDCANAVAPPAGEVTSFTDWDATAQRWGAGTALYGSVFSYAGQNATVNSPPTVEGTPQALHLTGTVPSNGYAGGGVTFLVCATVASFAQVQFQIYGRATNCDIQMQIQTYDQRPVDAEPPGSCTASTCYQSPGMNQIVSGSSLSSTVSTVTKALSSFSNWSAANAGQVVGLQWQISRTSGAASDCTYNVNLTGFKFL